MPNTLDAAVSMLGSLVTDPLLILGLQTVALILIGSGLIAWALLSRIAR